MKKKNQLLDKSIGDILKDFNKKVSRKIFRGTHGEFHDFVKREISELLVVGLEFKTWEINLISGTNRYQIFTYTRNFKPSHIDWWGTFSGIRFTTELDKKMTIPQAIRSLDIRDVIAQIKDVKDGIKEEEKVIVWYQKQLITLHRKLKKLSKP